MKTEITNTFPKTRECLITTGATAPFFSLIKASLNCLKTFRELGYTHITFQVGDGLDFFNESKPNDLLGLEIRAFAFTDDLYSQMRRLKPGSKREEGLLITHAGE